MGRARRSATVADAGSGGMMEADVSAAAWLFGVLGVVLAGIGVFFLGMRPALLPEDLRFLGRSDAEVDQQLPQLRTWLRLVFMVLGGHALAFGILTVYVAATGVREGRGSAVLAVAVAGAASIGVMVAVNLVLRSAFRWALAAVSLLWVAAIVAAVAV